MRNCIAGLFSVALLLGFVWTVNAQTPVPVSPATVVTVPEMSCPSCAKKLSNELLKVPGVAQATANTQGKTMTVVPRNGQAASPRQIWEAVERAGYQPSRLDGPSGSFTAKPKS